MKAQTKEKLDRAFEYCQENDKSMEYMIQYMQDYAGVDMDCVVNYLIKIPV